MSSTSNLDINNQEIVPQENFIVNNKDLSLSNFSDKNEDWFDVMFDRYVATGNWLDDDDENNDASAAVAYNIDNTPEEVEYTVSKLQLLNCECLSLVLSPLGEDKEGDLYKCQIAKILGDVLDIYSTRFYVAKVELLFLVTLTYDILSELLTIDTEDWLTRDQQDAFILTVMMPIVNIYVKLDDLGLDYPSLSKFLSTSEITEILEEIYSEHQLYVKKHGLDSISDPKELDEDVDEYILEALSEIAVIEDEIGKVISVKDGVAFVSGLENLQMGEMVDFIGKNIYGMALNLETEQVGVILFGNDTLINQDDEVIGLKRLMTIPTGYHLLGSVVDAIGNVIDEKSLLSAHAHDATYLNIERKAPGVITRFPVTEHF